MAYYAQKNYNQALEDNSYTIAQAGSLLTAFANLLQRYGIHMDPPKLDAFLAEHGSGPDLSWSSIGLVDKLISVEQVGAAVPPSSVDAIVKFHHQSLDTPVVTVSGQEVPNMVDHFCAVDRISGGQLFIIDSRDGLVKSPMTYERTYGKPLAWASYAKHIPVVQEPPKKTMIGRVAAPPKVMYSVVKDIPGYATAQLAASRGAPTVRVPARRYFVWDESDGMKNVGSTYGRPGLWINPTDNVHDTPVSKPAAAEYPTYAVIRELDGYETPFNALNTTQPTHRLSAGTYCITREESGMLQIAASPGGIAVWINPEDNVVMKTRQVEPAPVPAHAATEDNTVTETKQAAANDWRASYKPFSKQPANFYATKTFIIHDLEGKHPDSMCHLHDLAPLAGTFVGPDGMLYGRTMESTFPALRKSPAARQLPPMWYGLPLDNKHFMSEEELWDTQTDIVTRMYTHSLNFRDHLVIALGRLSGWLERLGKQKDVTEEG